MIGPLRSAILAVLFSTAGASGTARAATAADDALSRMATQLNELETGIALGDAAASAQQEPLLEHMAAAIQKADQKDWLDRDNRLALVVYLLGGGAPGVAAFAISNKTFPASDSQLIKGVLAYVLGRREEASHLLTPIDARTLAPQIAGGVAFAQSVLVPPNDEKQAIHLLEVARMLAPGGLVEESSLRQEIALAAKAKDTKSFAQCLRQYMLRFPHSLYAPDFVAALPEIIIDNNLVQSPPSLPLLRLGLSTMNKNLANLIILKVGRDMLLNGNIVVADWTASFVLRDPSLTPGQKSLAQVIQGVSRSMSGRDEAGTQELDHVDADLLPAGDQLLLVAAKTATREIRQDPFSDAKPQVGDKKDGAVNSLDGGVSPLVKAAVSNVNSFLSATRAQ